ncbi:hypothetical protein AB2B38_000905 [Balneola sp. MJW-20]|uniref:hypothetical protein n=1 Tax=Gracilimonas aurantiaca TaxID=3234185 RepID=UPI0034672312
MIYSNKFIYLLMPLVFLFSANLMAQDDKKHSLEDEAKALQFRINNNFTLGSFNGANFSYKRHTADDKAHRIGLTLATSSLNREFPDRANNPETEAFNFLLDGSFTWMNYVDPDAVIKLYYGYGPGLRFGYDKDFNGDDNVENTDKDRILGIAALGYAGVEWFFHPSVSIHAEYGAALRLDFERQLQRQELGTGNVNEDEVNTTIFSLAPTNVLFGISVYF